ncbi:MAG TPA: phenylalanine--tRNA ligase subunit alpha [Anaerolineales bacterium]|nr:phenylalanine--tRNA ligase subunit alpha [Anaerolineales bacterium]
MLEDLDKIKQTALAALAEAGSEAALEEWRVRFLGRKSPVMDVFSALRSLSPEERPAVGQRANEVRTALEAGLAERLETVRTAALRTSLQRDRLDVTLPGRPLARGRLHPVTQTMRRIFSVFAEMGFQIYRSRDVETDEMNFQLLNFQLHHPAREMQDSFYVDSGPAGADNPVLLRTHTSPGQIRSMRENSGYSGAGPLPTDPPPVRIILPGMCYRFEQITTRANVQFTQVEGLAVGKRITFGDLKGTLSDFARRMFGENVRTRFRASHFPFTEPSAEMDIECFVCGGAGCSVCKHAGWLEILGSGMVHPVVLRNGGYDPEVYTGFAFGMGPERITMLRHRIDDIRYFWDNDMRFLEQF